MMLSDEALDGYAKQYEFYKERLEKQGINVSLTFYDYISLREKFKDYQPRGEQVWEIPE